MMTQTSSCKIKSKLNLLFLLAVLLSVLTSSPEVTDLGAVFAAQDSCQCELLASSVTIQENESLDKSDSSKNENFEESLPQRSQNPTRADSRSQLQLVVSSIANALFDKSSDSTPICAEGQQYSTLPRWLMLRTLLI